MSVKSGQPQSHSVVLLCPSDERLRESGTGVVIAEDANGKWVLTCDHVVKFWAEAEGTNEATKRHVLVNNCPGIVTHCGAAEGLDLALIHVQGLPVQPIELRDFARPTTEVFGFGYAALANNDFVRETFRGSVKDRIAVHRRGAARPIRALTVELEKGQSIQPGNSGSPLFSEAGELIGLLSHRRGEHGIAIAGEEVNRFVSSNNIMVGPASGSEAPPPVPTTTPRDPDDKNKGRFKGREQAEGRKIGVSIAPTTRPSQTYMYFDVFVQSTDGSRLEPPVYFYLHESYSHPKIRITKLNNEGKEARLEDVYSYGVYTIGAHVKSRNGNWVSLELDLGKKRGVPAAVRSR